MLSSFRQLLRIVCGCPGEVNLSEGLLYLHPGAQQAYSNGDPRVAWLKYLQQNTPLQAASIMLISTTTMGFLISWWRKRHSNKLQQAHRQAIAELQNQLKIDPHQALLDTESLMQGYRLMMIEGNLSPDLYREIDHINDVFIQQCRSARQQQQSQELNEVIDYINSLITSTDRVRPSYDTFSNQGNSCLAKLSWNPFKNHIVN